MLDYKFDGRWEDIKYKFSAFEGLQSRMGAFTSMDKRQLSDGTVNMFISASLEQMEPSKEQIDTINWISINGDEIKETMFTSVKAYILKMKKLYGNEDDPDQKDWFPELNSSADLGTAMGVGNLTIQQSGKDAYCVYNLECGCTWDEEHGMGLIMYKNEVLHIGDAASSLGGGPPRDAEATRQREKALTDHKARMKTWAANPNDPSFYNEPKYYTKRHPKHNTLNPAQEEANKRYPHTTIFGGYADKFKAGIEDGHIIPDEELLTIAVTYCRVNILEEIKAHNPELISCINKVDKNGLTSLDKVYNKLASPHSYNKEYLGQIDALLLWLKSNGGKLNDDL